ncbi:Hypothetical protein GbCGDNIH2_7020 [Granulibacter bethesdensis]|nr:Hypothetical protein GbCGDNIH2_7020 [Granulibacter bethesdensis]APH58618.1 Hypothetical protein GbCGDNIH7_7020 [Granulibacter bethesdensis]
MQGLPLSFRPFRAGCRFPLSAWPARTVGRQPCFPRQEYPHTTCVPRWPDPGGSPVKVPAALAQSAAPAGRRAG